MWFLWLCGSKTWVFGLGIFFLQDGKKQSPFFLSCPVLFLGSWGIDLFLLLQDQKKKSYSFFFQSSPVHIFWNRLERDIRNSCFSDLMEKEWITASCYLSDSQAIHGLVHCSFIWGGAMLLVKMGRNFWVGRKWGRNMSRRWRLLGKKAGMGGEVNVGSEG